MSAKNKRKCHRCFTPRHEEDFGYTQSTYVNKRGEVKEYKNKRNICKSCVRTGINKSFDKPVKVPMDYTIAGVRFY